MSELNAISASRGSYRETADGSLEVKIIIDPRFKEDFHRIFKEKDMPVAIAPLVADFERVEATKEVDVGNDIPKGGFLSQWLAIRCGEPEFWRFVAEKSCAPNGITSTAQCDAEVKLYLGIDSKKELDHDKEAEKRFHEMIRLPYSRWLAGAR